MKSLAAHFEYLHNNPPPPFNPHYDPKAEDWHDRVATSMEKDDFYTNHTREECKAEFGRRYDIIKAEARATK